MGRLALPHSSENLARDKDDRKQSREGTPTSSSATPKPHVSGALKFVVGEEQRAQALAAADVWRQRFAEEAKWKNVVGRIERFAKEDHVREHHVVERRQTSSTHEPWLTDLSETKLEEETGDPVIKDSFNAEDDTPRVLGDLVTSIEKGKGKCIELNTSLPVSPPLGSPFSPGGFWECLTPTASGFATPITAFPRSSAPDCPASPTEPDAKNAYNRVKRDVTDTALRMYADRLSIHGVFDSSGQVAVKANMVRTKDQVEAAKIVLEQRQIKLKDLIDADLPAKMDALADEEAKMVRMNCIPSAKVLQDDVDKWLQIDEATLEFKTILDVQRDLLRRNKEARRNKHFAMNAAIQELVWATCILSDKQAELDGRGDGSSVHSDENIGYNYGNFMRMLHSDPTELARMVRGSRQSAAAAETDTHTHTHTHTHTQSLTSHTTHTTHDRTRADSSSTSSAYNSTTPSQPATRPENTQSPTPTPTPAPTLPRRTIATSSSDRRTHGLTISTSNLSHAAFAASASNPHAVSPAEVSPLEQRGQRRRGPSMSALLDWAETLRGFEEGGGGDGDVRGGRGRSSSSRYSGDVSGDEDGGVEEDGDGDGDGDGDADGEEVEKESESESENAGM